MIMTTENKNKVISGISTALFLLVVMLVCMAFGYDPPDPPIPEEGVEVNVGNSDMGLGDNPMPEASEPSSAPRPASATEQLATRYLWAVAMAAAAVHAEHRVVGTSLFLEQALDGQAGQRDAHNHQARASQGA